ncbi:MAG TPA: hypothetical protein VMW07_08460 [Gallionella sp.]|nr:hypothetical protein [Gallionella sp.]
MLEIVLVGVAGWSVGLFLKTTIFESTNGAKLGSAIIFSVVMWFIAVVGLNVLSDMYFHFTRSFSGAGPAMFSFMFFMGVIREKHKSNAVMCNSIRSTPAIAEKKSPLRRTIAKWIGSGAILWGVFLMGGHMIVYLYKGRFEDNFADACIFSAVAVSFGLFIIYSEK